jgi:hypothetical protein
MVDLDGLYTRESETTGETYYLIELTRSGLGTLSALLSMPLEEPFVVVVVGDGQIRFEMTPHGGLTAAHSPSGLVIRGGADEFATIADRLDKIAQEETGPDYVIHVHLDNYFSTPPSGLSDVVFQRL